MKIESLKHLLAEKINYDEEYFSHDTYKEALLLAIKALERISEESEYCSGIPAEFALKGIEKIFE